MEEHTFDNLRSQSNPQLLRYERSSISTKDVHYFTRYDLVFGYVLFRKNYRELYNENSLQIHFKNQIRTHV